ncbi:MAG: phosphoribosylaminoimidazolesuccinocarboxamide synthase, partial [Candidatus Pacebacteria bacterium]|nr:phosphoribosylaminoimidazolesuccinocarboxamide synthase [Candidatus Paceibacterota bacterium]
IPIELVVRNFATGSIVKRLRLEEGKPLPRPLIEYFYKNDEMADPMVAEDHISVFGWASPSELDEMVTMALRVNDYLSGLFYGIGIKLIDFKLEFGRLYDEDGGVMIILADEISPDNCRLWDVKTGYKLDKDRFRHDLGQVKEAYQEVARRLGVLPEMESTANTANNGGDNQTTIESIAPSKFGTH